jgi:hypothetical protein
MDEYSMNRLSPAGTEVKLVKYLRREPKGDWNSR